MEQCVALIVILMTAAQAMKISSDYGKTRTLIRNQPILALHYSDAANELRVYTDKKELVVKGNGDVAVVGLLASSSDRVTDIAKNPNFGTLTVNYYSQCITLTGNDGRKRKLGLCEGQTNNVTSADITPYSATFAADGKVVFTDEFSDMLKVWNPETGAVVSMDKEKIARPRGIVYVESTDTYLITMSHGIYLTNLRDSHEIIGVSDESAYGFKDGKSDSTVRFSHPTSIVALTPYLFAVGDFSNNKIRIVDLAGKEVTTLCAASSSITDCDSTAPTSLAITKDRSKLFVGTSTGLLELNLTPPNNLCYGLDSSGEAVVTIDGRAMNVWCDLDSNDGPWITVLKRFDGNQNFNKSYTEYSSGFGDVGGEYWIGLENLYRLTNNKKAKLRIDVEGFRTPRGATSAIAYARYEKFWLASEATEYTLEEISDYTGTAGDMETMDPRTNLGGPHKGQKFSTFDKDADGFSDNCAGEYNGGWWFKSCFTACLTCGPYADPPRRGYGTAMMYFPFTKAKVGLKSSSMKVYKYIMLFRRKGYR